MPVVSVSRLCNLELMKFGPEAIDGLSIGSQDPENVFVHRKVVFYAPATGLTHPPAERGISENEVQRGHRGSGIQGGHQDSGFTVDHGFRSATRGGGNYGPPAGHGLKINNAQRFMLRRQTQHVSVAIKVG